MCSSFTAGRAAAAACRDPLTGVTGVALVLSLANWQESWGRDAGTRKTSRVSHRLSEMRLEYNATNAPVVSELPGVFDDASGVRHANRITLEPYSSVVRMLRN